MISAKVSVFLLLSLPLMAQTSLSTLRCNVTDQSGAVVPGVEVTAEEISTNIRARMVTTDHLGNYEMPDLQKGRIDCARS